MTHNGNLSTNKEIVSKYCYLVSGEVYLFIDFNIGKEKKAEKNLKNWCLTKVFFTPATIKEKEKTIRRNKKKTNLGTQSPRS